jgi:CheY-like chemotaxis protein
MNEKKRKILIVEDELIIANDLKFILSGLGYEISSVAATAEEAINAVEKNRPDLVLMDIVLKGEKDGIETAEVIILRFDIPVVYLTAFSNQNVLDRAKKTRPYGFIAKPVDRETLHTTIEVAISKHEAEKLLKKSEEKYRLLYTSMNEGFSLNELVFDESGKAVDYRILDANPAFQRITGLKGKTILGKKASELYGQEKPLFLEIYAVRKSLYFWKYMPEYLHPENPNRLMPISQKLINTSIFLFSLPQRESLRF